MLGPYKNMEMHHLKAKKALGDTKICNGENNPSEVVFIFSFGRHAGEFPPRVYGIAMRPC